MKPDNPNTNTTATSMKRLKRQGGFTLIEVLIALTIFAVGLLAIAALQTSAIRMNSTAGRMTDLTALGMDTLEQLMGMSYTDLQLTAGNHPDVSASDGYTVSYTVADDSPVPGTKQIMLTVRGNGKILSLKTIKAQSQL